MGETLASELVDLHQDITADKRAAAETLASEVAGLRQEMQTDKKAMGKALALEAADLRQTMEADKQGLEEMMVSEVAALRQDMDLEKKVAGEMLSTEVAGLRHEIETDKQEILEAISEDRCVFRVCMMFVCTCVCLSVSFCVDCAGADISTLTEQMGLCVSLLVFCHSRGNCAALNTTQEQDVREADRHGLLCDDQDP